MVGGEPSVNWLKNSGVGSFKGAMPFNFGKLSGAELIKTAKA